MDHPSSGCSCAEGSIVAPRPGGAAHPKFIVPAVLRGSGTWGADVTEPQEEKEEMER